MEQPAQRAICKHPYQVDMFTSITPGTPVTFEETAPGAAKYKVYSAAGLLIINESTLNEHFNYYKQATIF